MKSSIKVNDDLSTPLHYVFHSDELNHILGGHFEFSELHNGFDLGYKWGEFFLVFCQNMADMHARFNFTDGWEVTTSRGRE